MLQTADALKLIEQLQNFVVQRNEVVEELQNQLAKVSEERDQFKDEVKNLQRQNSALKMLVGSPSDGALSGKMILTQTQSVNNNIMLDTGGRPITPDRETSSHGESTSYNTVNEERTSKQQEPERKSKPVVKTPSKKLIHRTSSRDRARPHRNDSANLYELSTDIAEKAIECLEKKYGGKEKANGAARTIQHSYRHWILNKGFLRVRAYSGRRRSLTMPEKQFQLLKNKSLVFYGPENPVMIVDGDFELNNIEPDARSIDTLDDEDEVREEKPNIMDLAKEEGMRMYSQSTVDSDDNDETLIGDDVEEKAKCPHEEEKVAKEDEGKDVVDQRSSTPNEERIVVTKKEKKVITVTKVKDDNEERLIVTTNEELIVSDSEQSEDNLDEDVDRTVTQGNHTDEGKDQGDRVSLRSTISTGSETSESSQYDIIDDSSVVTVVSKSSVNLQDGSKLTVDKLYDDSPDGMSFSTPQDEPDDIDKAMHKRQFRIGVNLFNWKPEVGIQYLIDNSHIKSDVKSIAKFLRKETTVSKQKISEYFGNLRNEFNSQVLEEFGKSFDFVNKDVDEALRQFQSYFKLTGEAQTVEKFLQVFSDRYVECNPGRVSDNPDTILLLAFALAMLNTDLHNQNVKRRMSPEDFMKNLRGTDNGNDLDQEMLRNMYIRIQKNEFATGADHTTQLHQIENSFIGKTPSLAVPHRQFVKLYTVEEVHETNRKDKQLHNRLAFLFNDLLILAKPRGKGGSHGAGHMFTCKASYPLLGKKVAEFSNEHYSLGVLLVGRFDNKVVATFNMKDEKTRRSFVDELDEYIRETTGMENIRLALSKVNQLTWHNRRKDDGRTKSLLLQDSSSSSKMEAGGAETTSLTDLRIGSNHSNEGENNQNKIMTSASMGDINEVESDSEDFEGMQRTNSANSLGPPRITNFSTTKGSSQQTGNGHSMSRTTSVKTLFGHWAPKFRKSMTYNDSRRRGSSSANETDTPLIGRDRRHHSHLQARDISPSPPVKRNRTPSVLSEGSNAEKRKSAFL